MITVENKRTVTLKGLQIALAGGGGKVVGKLAKEVAGGKSARVALKGAKGCEYNVKWEFEDASDEFDRRPLQRSAHRADGLILLRLPL